MSDLKNISEMLMSFDRDSRNLAVNIVSNQYSHNGSIATINAIIVSEIISKGYRIDYFSSILIPGTSESLIYRNEYKF